MERAGKQLSQKVLDLDSPSATATASVPIPVGAPRRGVLKVAVALRAVRQRKGSASFFFTPASQTGGWLVYQVADALSRIDDASILILDIRAGNVEAVGLAPNVSPVADNLLSNLKQLASAELAVPGDGALVPASRDNAPVVLSDRLLSFLDDAMSCFGYVLLDAPSVLAEPASVVAASMCDGVVITVVQGVTRLQSVTEVRQQLAVANANVIGFVMEGSRSE